MFKLLVVVGFFILPPQCGVQISLLVFFGKPQIQISSGAVAA